MTIASAIYKIAKPVVIFTNNLSASAEPKAELRAVLPPNPAPIPDLLLCSKIIPISIIQTSINTIKQIYPITPIFFPYLFIIFQKSRGFNEAPPIKKPFKYFADFKSKILLILTLPPYKI